MEGYQNFQEKLDIKILILFILRRLPDAVTRETLTDLALSEGNAGYFEYSECLAELVDSHQVEQEGNLYKISERGARNCEIVESSLPMTVRQKMEKNIKPVADELRRRAMKLDKIDVFDLYVPIVEDVDYPVSYEEAKELVRKAVAPLGEEYGKLIDRALSERWIDVYENVGKRSGAYSAGALVHSFVLLNYTGTLDSQFTLAHEMGHALHSYLSNHTQPTIYQDYVIFVAEVASTCNEALLMEYLLGKTTDKKQRAYLINHFLDQFKGTVYRQTMFAEFERELGRMAERGETLTADALDE